MGQPDTYILQDQENLDILVLNLKMYTNKTTKINKCIGIKRENKLFLFKIFSLFLMYQLNNKTLL